MTAPLQWEPGPLLRRHLQICGRERSPATMPKALRHAERHAFETFQAAGLQTSLETIPAGGGVWHNVVADHGGGEEDPLFIIGAHLDTVAGSPGADDNGSGAAALLALAEWLGERNPGAAPRPPATLRLIAFNLEEQGMIGSSYHAARLRAARRTVTGMIALEMVGYAHPGPQRYPPGLGAGRRRSADFISVVGNLRSRQLVQRVRNAFESVPGLPVESICLPGPIAMLIGATLSDHAPFWRHRVPAAMVGDTAFYRNPNYHRASDTIDTLNLVFLADVARGLAHLATSVLQAGPPG